MRSWEEIEKRRKALEISRAELARQAGVSESTIFKGLGNKSRPSNAVYRQIDGVLTSAEEARAQA